MPLEGAINLLVYVLIIILIIVVIIWAIKSFAYGEMSVCFNDLNDYFEFRLKDIESQVYYPCPNVPMLDNSNPIPELK